MDLLRGLAIGLVLMNHVNMRLAIAKVPYTRGLPAQLASSLFWNGQLGVQIFFAVSGFLIASTTLRRWGSLARVSPPDFYRLRLARIAPLLALLLVVLSALHLAGLQDFVVPEKRGGLGRALVSALTFHINVLEARRGYLPASWDVLWSLSVEETFYLGFPLLCRLVARFASRDRFLIPIFAAFVVAGPFGRTVLAGGSGTWREYSYLGGMDAIALGCLTALLTSRVRFSRRGLRALTAGGMALLVFSLCFSIEARKWGLHRTGLDMSVLALGTCLLIAVAAQTQWRSPRVFAPLVRLGRRSYEVYLTHMFVVFALFDWFVGRGEPMGWVPALFIAAVPLSGLLGEAVARLYSEPMNRRLRLFWGDGANRLGSVIEGEREPA